MFKNLWYVVAPSAHIGTQPHAVQLLGQPFVAYRDSGGHVRLLSDLCVHRGGALSGGRRVGDSLACPYHGWQFGSDGVCRHIPAQPGLKVPARARVDAYPVQERYGWVWAFLGDLPEHERPPLPELAWWERADLRVSGGHYDWSVGWDRVMENGLDFAHAAFVHGDSFGDPDRPEMGSFDVRSANVWHAEATMLMQRPVRRGWRRRPTGEYVAVDTRPGFHLSGPCVTLELRLPNGWTMFLVSAHVPVSAQRTRTWWQMGRSFLRSALFDGATARRNLRIFEQDHAVLRQVRPERVPEGWQQEVSVRSDALQIAFRQRLHDLRSRGWQLDEARVEEEFRGRQACAIPCPARSEAPGQWPIPAIPLIPAQDA